MAKFNPSPLTHTYILLRICFVYLGCSRDGSPSFGCQGDFRSQSHQVEGARQADGLHGF